MSFRLAAARVIRTISAMLIKALLLAAAVGLGMAAPAWAHSALAADSSCHRAVRVLASWYGLAHQGLLTASGEPFDRNQLTAAHRSLPLGTLLRITNPANGRQVLVRINDRGPFVSQRTLDLSERAARTLGTLVRGEAWVLIEIAGVQSNGPRVPHARKVSSHRDGIRLDVG